MPRSARKRTGATLNATGSGGNMPWTNADFAKACRMHQEEYDAERAAYDALTDDEKARYGSFTSYYLRDSESEE